MKIPYTIVIALMLGAPAVAAQTGWSQQSTRGVEAFTLTQGGYAVTLTCDPDQVYGADNTNLSVTEAGQPLEGKYFLAFNSPDYKTLELDTTNGVVLRSNVAEDDWRILVDGLTNGVEFAIVTADIKPIFSPEAGFVARCY